MRYSALYVDSIGKWAVIDTLSDLFVPGYYDTELEAAAAASVEEDRWSTIVDDALSTVG